MKLPKRRWCEVISAIAFFFIYQEKIDSDLLFLFFLSFHLCFLSPHFTPQKKNKKNKQGKEKENMRAAIALGCLALLGVQVSGQNLKDGQCVQNFDANTDYFPDKLQTSKKTTF